MDDPMVMRNRRLLLSCNGRWLAGWLVSSTEEERVDGWPIELRDREEQQHLGLLFTCKVNAHKTLTIPETARRSPRPRVLLFILVCFWYLSSIQATPPSLLSYLLADPLQHFFKGS